MEDSEGLWVNLEFSYGPKKDEVLFDEGCLFLGAGLDSDHKEIHVFLKAGAELPDVMYAPSEKRVGAVVGARFSGPGMPTRRPGV